MDPSCERADRWLRIDSGALPVYVAFGDQGVSYVRTAGSVSDRAESFVAAYRRRYGRPLQEGDRPPAGLVDALRTGRAAEVRLDLRGMSPFQRDVLEVTAGIPPGETRPYGWVAGQVGRPRAVRAVGTALGRNPVPVLVPCHRVTRWDGSPGGYAFGSSVKEALLRHEQVDLDEVLELARKGVLYLGSASTGTLCLPTCHHLGSTRRADRRGFRTTGEGRGAGYRPCAHCRPAMEETLPGA